MENDIQTYYMRGLPFFLRLHFFIASSMFEHTLQIYKQYTIKKMKTKKKKHIPLDNV